MFLRRLGGVLSSNSPLYNFAIESKKLTIGVPREVYPNESRVAITPDTIKRVIKQNGSAFVVESGAGNLASISDQDYVAAGARIGSAQDAFQADVVLKVRPPS